MSESWKHYQRTADAYIRKAEHALESGLDDDAKTYLLLAAENLFRAARHAPAGQQGLLIKHADDVLELAENRAGEKQPVANNDQNDDTTNRPWQVVRDTGVSFDQVVGLYEPKRAIYNMVIRPMADPEGAARWGKKIGGGILLYGPPGTGKTLFARAIAGELDVPFLSVVGSSLVDKWVGQAEKNVTRLFEEAGQYDCCVLFIDETEALLPRRGGGSTVMDRVVPAFLAAMDGIAGRKDGLILLGATNRPQALDPAALRRNRFQHKVYVGLPDPQARCSILSHCLNGKPLGDDVDLESIVKETDGYSGADLAGVAEEAAHHAWDREERTQKRSKLSAEDFRHALKAVPPSVSKKDIEAYEKFKRHRYDQ